MSNRYDGGSIRTKLKPAYAFEYWNDQQDRKSTEPILGRLPSVGTTIFAVIIIICL